MRLARIARPYRPGASHRFRWARRVAKRERDSLGLQPGVGVDDQDLDRARHYRALEILIGREIREAELRPLAKIGFDGRPAPRLVTTLENPSNEALSDEERTALMGGYTAIRNTASSPLDYLFHQSKNPIDFVEWLAGKHFAHDFHVASGGRGLSQSLGELMLAKIAKLTPAERKAERIRPVTFKPRRAKRQRQGPSTISDARLDGMARLGRLCDSVSPISWFLLVEIAGQERWIKDVALQLREPAEYVGKRFRESLVEAAAHYRMMPASRPRRQR